MQKRIVLTCLFLFGLCSTTPAALSQGLPISTASSQTQSFYSSDNSAPTPNTTPPPSAAAKGFSIIGLVVAVLTDAQIYDSTEVTITPTAQVSAPPSTPQLTTPTATSPTPTPKLVDGLPPVYQVGVISQDDHNQYLSEAQFQRWHGSVCSAASITSVLVAYGFPTKLGDVLNFMQDDGTIDPWIGLANNDGFRPLASKYGLHANIDKNQDVDAHFNNIMNQLQNHQPVIVNVKDGALYPNGHFVVAFNVNSQGYVGIMNPDWHGKYPPGLQAWPTDELKALFSRALLSVTFSR